MDNLRFTTKKSYRSDRNNFIACFVLLRNPFTIHKKNKMQQPGLILDRDLCPEWSAIRKLLNTDHLATDGDRLPKILLCVAEIYYRTRIYKASREELDEVFDGINTRSRKRSRPLLTNPFEPLQGVLPHDMFFFCFDNDSLSNKTTVRNVLLLYNEYNNNF